jgi:hypothetical protein
MRIFPASSRWVLVGAIGLVAGCGSDGSASGTGPGDGSASADVAAACGRITDAECAKLVECKVEESGMLITTALCAQIRATAVSDCQTKESAGISGASASDIDACVAGFQAVACTSLCNQVPQDPPACQKLSPTPNTMTFTCAP